MPASRLAADEGANHTASELSARVSAPISSRTVTATAVIMAAMTVTTMTVRGIGANRALHGVDNAVQRSQQGMNVAGIAVHVAVTTTGSGIDHLVNVVRQCIDLFQITQDVTVRRGVAVCQAVHMFDFTFDFGSIVDQMFVDRSMTVVLTKFGAQLADNRFELMGLLNQRAARCFRSRSAQYGGCSNGNDGDNF